MPHLILEYSANILEKKNLVPLFHKCHVALEQLLPTEIASCKSRAVEHTVYCIGKGAENQAFVHVTLKVMPGRTEITLEKVGNHLLEILQEHFTQSREQLTLQITLEIKELEQTYFKAINK